MSDREKEILTNIGKALPGMSDFDKGYLLGIVEANARKEKECGNRGAVPAER